MRKRSKLCFEEYQEIYKLNDKFGFGVREIARNLGRSASTISRFLRRKYKICSGVWKSMNCFEKALYAWRQAKKRRKRRRLRLKTQRIRNLVKHILCKWHWSPENISSFLYRHGLKISAKSIYNFIKKEREDLEQYLFEKGKIRRQRVVHRRGILKQGAPKKKSIHERAKIEGKGHWEGDTIHSNKTGKGGVLTIRELYTKQCFYFPIKDLKAERVTSILLLFFQGLPADLRKTFTVDNGSEFEHLFKLEKVISDFKVYYCDAYKSWQKGSVEQANRELRWFFEKGTDFSKVSEEAIKKAQYKINGKPRPSNNGFSSAKLFKALLKAA